MNMVNKKRWSIGTMMVFSFVVLLVSNSNAVNYYVNDTSTVGDIYCSSAGSDASNGLTVHSPKATITNLISIYPLGPNDVVYIDSGLYNACVRVTAADSGNATGYVTFQGAGAKTVLCGYGSDRQNDGAMTLDGASYIKINDIKFKNATNECYGIYILNNSKNIFLTGNFVVSNSWSGIRINNSTFCTVKGSMCNYNNRNHIAWPAGIQLYSCKFIDIEDNTCISNVRGVFIENNSETNHISGNILSSNSESGIRIDGSGCKYNSVSSNFLYANANVGLYMISMDYNVVKNNLIYCNGGDGIYIDSAASGSMIKNCVLFKNGGNGIKLNAGSLQVKNCISLSNGGYGYLQTAGTITGTYLDAFGNVSGGYGSFTPTSSMNLDPKFISLSPGSADFLRLSAGSPCIDAGDPADTVPLNGGSAIDMGAFEVITIPVTIVIPPGNLVIYNNYLTMDHPLAKIFMSNPGNAQSKMTLRVYTVYGQLVKELAAAKLSEITLPVVWDGKDSSGKDVSSGVYIIHANGYKYDEKKRIYVVR